jgi:hypothetical protein
MGQASIPLDAVIPGGMERSQQGIFDASLRDGQRAVDDEFTFRFVSVITAPSLLPIRTGGGGNGIRGFGLFIFPVL